MPPSLMIPIVLLTPFMVLTIYVASGDGEWGVTGIALAMIGLLFLMYVIDRGYRLSLDQRGIYMRNWGLRSYFVRDCERLISFEDIGSIEGAFKGNAGAKSMFMPFEFLEVRSVSGDIEDIWIYPPSFRDADIKSFLWHIHDRRPELFPDSVLTYMRSERPL